MMNGNKDFAPFRKLGATGIGVWLIKHVVSPLDRFLYRLTGGRWFTTGRPLGPVLLLTTRGRKTGKVRTTPVFYLREGDRIVLCNANPGFEHPNPWTLNLLANPLAVVQIGYQTAAYNARLAGEEETGHYWPQLVAIWPAYQTYYERSGKRSVFILEPVDR
jgi:deazaflavin-dependent oxidoreductase (nitroreductase family)